jgi:hypothetical protein
MREAMDPWARGSNQEDFADMRVRHREIYQMRPILAANSGGGGQNQGRRGGGDSVAGARLRGGRKGGTAHRLAGSGATEPPVLVQPGGLVPDRWGQGGGGWARK